MKKLLTLCAVFAAFLLCSQRAFAAEAGKVDSVSATGTTTSVEVSGTVSSDDVFAVAIQVRDKSGAMLTMESTGVSNKCFSLTLTGLPLLEETSYDVYAANYDGGEWKITEFTVPKNEDPGTDPGNDPGNTPGNDPGNTPGNDPGNTPGNDPGNTPGNDPGNTPGSDPGTDPDNSGNGGNSGAVTPTNNKKSGTKSSVTSVEPTVSVEEMEVTEEISDEEDELSEDEEVTPEVKENEPVKEPEKETASNEPISIGEEKTPMAGWKIALISVGGVAVVGTAAYFLFLAGKKDEDDEDK